MDPVSEKLEPSALEQSLLEAARGDRIPSALSARMADGLGLQAAAAGASAAPLFSSTGLWGALSAAVLITLGAYQLTRPMERVASTAVPQAASMQVEAARASVPMPARTEAPVPALTEAAPVPAEPEQPAIKRAAAPDDAALRAETTLLARAHAALRSGESARALRLLDQHGKRFAAPLLKPEADALRIEALAASGAQARARALATRFEREHPSHPLRERVIAALQ